MCLTFASFLIVCVFHWKNSVCDTHFWAINTETRLLTVTGWTTERRKGWVRTAPTSQRISPAQNYLSYTILLILRLKRTLESVGSLDWLTHERDIYSLVNCRFLSWSQAVVKCGSFWWKTLRSGCAAHVGTSLNSKLTLGQLYYCKFGRNFIVITLLFPLVVLSFFSDPHKCKVTVKFEK